ASRSAITTEAPSSANRRAMASPMPCAEPVTTATFPLNRCWRSVMCSVLLDRGSAVRTVSGRWVSDDERLFAPPARGEAGGGEGREVERGVAAEDHLGQ